MSRKSTERREKGARRRRRRAKEMAVRIRRPVAIQRSLAAVSWPCGSIHWVLRAVRSSDEGGISGATRA